MKMLFNRSRQCLLLSVVLVLSVFSIPMALASPMPMLSLAGLHVDKFNPKEQPGFWFAGLGTVLAGRTSKKIRDLQAKKASLVTSARALTTLAETENRDLSEEEATQFDALRGQIESVNAAIERESALIAEEASVGIVAEHIVDRATLDEKRGFKSFGEFAKTVRLASNGHSAMDERLAISAAAPGIYGNESSGADGGFAVPPEFSRDIWKLSLGEGSLLPFTANTEITGNSMVFPKDETTPWGSSGVQSYWRAEGPAANGSKPVLGTDALRLHEQIVLIPVTNELLEDAPALGSYISPLAVDRIMWKTNEAILFGTGVGQPHGALNSNAAIVVAKESNQATGTISQPNISKMRSRLKTGELKNAIWVGNPDILPALEGLTVGNIPIFLPPGTGIRADYDGTLNGRPLLLSEHASAFSAQGDLSLLALSGYRTITKSGGIETATSMHLYFDANAMAFRFIFRIDGRPIISAPIQPPAGKSSNTRSYFITLGAR